MPETAPGMLVHTFQQITTDKYFQRSYTRKQFERPAVILGQERQDFPRLDESYSASTDIEDILPSLQPAFPSGSPEE